MALIDQNNHKLSILEKCAYGAGDMACNLFWGLICIASAFYTEYFGLEAGVVATMMLVVACIDIAFDVVIGAVADRHKTKWGRFRPWILFGVVPFCIIGVVTFTTPEFDTTAKTVYAYITFLLMRLMYSVVNVPYGALMGVMSADSDERDKVSAFRNIGAQIGCMVSYGFVFTIVRFIMDSMNVNGQKAFSTTALIYATAAFILLMITFLFTRERVEPAAQEQSNLSQDLKDLGANKPWIMLTIANISMLFFVFVHNGLIAYYAKYYLADSYDTVNDVAVFNATLFGFQLNWETISTILLSMGSILTIIGTMLIRPIASKFGKKPTWIGCFVLASVCSIMLLFIDRTNIGMVLLFNLLFSLTIGPSGYMVWSMYADVADNAEVETGRRATGLIYSSATMAQKLGQAVANSLPIYCLAAVGFVANTQLSAETIDSIKTIYTLAPVVGGVVGIIALCFYTIDEDKVKSNSEKLAQMKANGGSDVVTQ